MRRTERKESLEAPSEWRTQQALPSESTPAAESYQPKPRGALLEEAPRIQDTMSRSLDLERTPQGALLKPLEGRQTLAKSDRLASGVASSADKGSTERPFEPPIGQSNFTHYLKMQASHRYRPVRTRERTRKRMDLNQQTIIVDEAAASPTPPSTIPNVNVHINRRLPLKPNPVLKANLSLDRASYGVTEAEPRHQRAFQTRNPERTDLLGVGPRIQRPFLQNALIKRKKHKINIKIQTNSRDRRAAMDVDYRSRMNTAR